LGRKDLRLAITQLLGHRIEEHLLGIQSEELQHGGLSEGKSLTLQPEVIIPEGILKRTVEMKWAAQFRFT